MNNVVGVSFENAFKLCSVAWMKEQVGATKIAIEGAVRCTASDESLVDGGVVRVPVEPVLAEVGMGSRFGGVRGKELVHVTGREEWPSVRSGGAKKGLAGIGGQF